MREALAAPRGRGIVHELFVTARGRDAARRHRRGRRGARASMCTVVSGEVMSSLSQTVTPQGIVAVCALPRRARSTRSLAAAAAGWSPCSPTSATPATPAPSCARPTRPAPTRVVLTDECVDPYNGKCVRASAGSLFHLPVAVGRAGRRRRDRPCGRAGLRVLAADGRGELDLDEATDAGRLDGPTAWVFGNEAWGLPDETRALADAVVRVPIHGRGREPQPRHRRRRLPLRLGPRAAHSTIRLTAT